MPFRLSMGDRVRVRDDAYMLAVRTSSLCFNMYMERLQGKSGTVKRVTNVNGHLNISFDENAKDNCNWWWLPEWVDILQINVESNAFVCGSKVQVLPKVSEEVQRKNNVLWTNKDAMVGKIGTISTIDHNGDLTISFPEKGMIPYWSTKWVRPIQDANIEKKRKWADIGADLSMVSDLVSKIERKINS